MTRTTKTAAAAPAPRGRNGKVRTVKVTPETLAGLDLKAPKLDLKAELAAELAKPAKHQRKAPTPRVALTAAQLATLEAIGWKAPLTTADLTLTPKPAKRPQRNECKGGKVYNVLARALTAGHVLTVVDVADLWIEAGHAPKPLNALLQQVSNRAGRTIQQTGATIAAV